MAPLSSERSKSASVETSKGRVIIQSYCSPDAIEKLEIESGIGIFPNYRSIIRGKETLINIAQRADSNVVLAYLQDKKIIGYAIFTAPDPISRWGQGDTEGLIEFAVLEVSRNWRSQGVARAILGLAFDDDDFDDKIVVSTEFSWHWDLEYSGLEKAAYRQRLLKLLKEYGFQLFPTNEPNILLDPVNMLTARVGEKTSNTIYLNFQAKLFGANVPWARAIE